MARDDLIDDGPTDPHRTLDPEERLLLHGEATGDDLLAAVLADPDNDEPRLVYGDYLLDRGDPRGEYIQLQLEQARLQTHDEARWHRMRELAKDRMAEWCAPLYPALDHTAIGFRRGFLWQCGTHDRTIALRDVIGHPMWRTVGQLVSTDETLVSHACLRTLRTLQTNPQALGELARAEHETKIECVSVQGVGPFRTYADSHWRSHREEVAWGRIHAGGPALHNVRTLMLYNQLEALSPRTGELLDSPFGRQLETLELWIERCGLVDWAAVVLEHETLRRLVIHTGRGVDRRRPGDRGGVVLEREGDHLKLIVEVDGHLRIEEAIDAAASVTHHFDSVEVATIGTEPSVDALAPILIALRELFDEVNVEHRPR